MDMKKKITLPLVTYKDIENCRAILDITLKDADTAEPVLSIRGSIPILDSFGQIREEVKNMYPNDKFVQRICELWQNYHLNDIHAGCVHQRAFEKEPYEKHKHAHCDICNYTYGTSWLYEPIPQEVLTEIKDIITK